VPLYAGCMRAAPGAPPRRPSGPRLQAFRAKLLNRWGPRAVCYHCQHRAGPAGFTLQHLVSPETRPDLAYDEGNVRPCHAGGRYRCPEPECNLACQQVSAGNQAPRDAQGRPVPFPAAFLRAKQAERQAWLAAHPETAPRLAVARSAPARARPASDVGREW
jgi:hypothetical protein